MKCIKKNSMIILVILFILFIIYVWKGKKMEGFTWSKQTVHDFLKFQDTVNRNTQFNMEQIQQQASEEEVQELLKTGSWPWSRDTENEYLERVAHNTMLKIDPVSSMKTQKTVYNENAMQQLLSWNTKEGQFLLNGTIIENNNGTIRCTTNVDGSTTLQKKVLKGYNLWNGYGVYDIINDVVPSEVPGFQFVKSPCNPCVALDYDYSCPFQINTKKDGNKISSIWKKLWNI